MALFGLTLLSGLIRLFYRPHFVFISHFFKGHLPPFLMSGFILSFIDFFLLAFCS